MIFGKKQPTSEPVSSLPNFILQQIRESKAEENQPTASSIDTNIETKTYNFRWEISETPLRNPNLSLEDWHRWLKEWRRKEEERKKEERAKDRLRLREERLKLERQKQERLKREQQLREEQLRQEQRKQDKKLQHSNQQKATANFWGSSLSNSSGGKKYVQSYLRKDGTYVKGHYRNRNK
jgi:flagellar biosynthesis GTPase FlhF